jgi:hypothetical protein
MGIIQGLSKQRNVLPFEGGRSQEYLSLVDLSTWHSAPITRGCGSELASAAPTLRLRQGRASNYRCHSPLLRHIDLRAIRRVLLSIDLEAFTASIPVRTSIPAREHQDKANVASALETHRGLIAHEEPAPPSEVFSDDE